MRVTLAPLWFSVASHPVVWSLSLSLLSFALSAHLVLDVSSHERVIERFGISVAKCIFISVFAFAISKSFAAKGGGLDRRVTCTRALRVLENYARFVSTNLCFLPGGALVTPFRGRFGYVFVGRALHVLSHRRDELIIMTVFDRAGGRGNKPPTLPVAVTAGAAHRIGTTLTERSSSTRGPGLRWSGCRRGR